jgi:hypothetical protein
MHSLLDLNTRGKASRLLHFALSPRLTTANDESKDYASLIAEYTSNEPMREAFSDLCAGLGMSVKAITPQQLIVTADSGSVFRARNPDGAVRIGVAVLATLTAFWPTPIELDRSGLPSARVPRVRVEDVVQTLRRIVTDAEPGTPQAAMAMLRDDDADHTGRNTLGAFVRSAIRELINGGMLTEQGDTYAPTQRCAALARHLAQNHQFQGLQNA